MLYCFGFYFVLFINLKFIVYFLCDIVFFVCFKVHCDCCVFLCVIFIELKFVVYFCLCGYVDFVSRERCAGTLTGKMGKGRQVVFLEKRI